ncbi:MAG TPA: DUF72 domain-containing protein [Nitrospira sp.]|nr:DUF72 domain-containing protein [Nitrospira sp.]
MDDKSTLMASERHARRQLRRERQRAANLGRAAKMHKARMTENPDLLPHTAGEIPKINIGCSGWFYWHWRGGFYPGDMPTKQWFRHYADHFKTVELNAPFYAWPTVGTVQSWRRQAGRRHFIYTVKVCELITHIKRFQGTKELVADFTFIADMLGPMMGCFLFQLPPGFHYTPVRLKAVLGQLDHRRRNVVEFRHASWWNETVFSTFRDTGTIFCSCSGPRLPDDLIKTSTDIYVRFHGTRQWYQHDYSKEELTMWANRISESGAERVWAYFNNDRNGYAIINARALSRLLQNKA